MLLIVFPTNKATDTPDTNQLNSVLHNKGGAMSPIRQLDTLWSQEDRHNPTWTICRQFPRNRRRLCSLSRAVLLSAAVFYGRHPSFLLCFLQCRHHTIPTKWPQHSTPWWQLWKSLPTQLCLCQGKAIVGYVYFGHSIDWSLYFCIFIVFTMALLKCEVVFVFIY